MNKLTDQQIFDWLEIGFNIPQNSSVTLDKSVLLLIVRKAMQSGTNQGTMTTKWREGK